MTPEYLEELADFVDPESLWRLSMDAQLSLPPEKRKQLDAGVAIRRQASHVRRLRDALERKVSLLITPLFENGTASRTIETPPDHANLRRKET